jgi:hypothetical protein
LISKKLFKRKSHQVAAVTLAAKMKEDISKEKGNLVEGDSDSLQLHHFWAVRTPRKCP